MDPKVRTINIIKILESDGSTSDDINTLISKIALCFKYLEAHDIYDVIGKELENTQIADIKKIFKKYDLPEDFFEGDNLTNPNIDNITVIIKHCLIIFILVSR